MTSISNASPEWLENQYRLWLENPDAVPADLRAYFLGFETGSQSGSNQPDAELALKQSAVDSLIYRYRDLGHLQASTDPLTPNTPPHPDLALEAFDLSEEDLDTVFHTKRFIRESATLREILEVLQQTYCRTIGVEFMHIQNPAERQWLKDRMETVCNRPP